MCGQLTWVGLHTALVRATVRRRSSVNTSLLLGLDRGTARSVLDGWPLASAGGATDGLVALVAARMAYRSDEPWIGTPVVSRWGTYTKQQSMFKRAE